MQFSGDTALATAIDSTVRRIEQRIEFDWERDGTWDHSLADMSQWSGNIVVDRDLMSALPEECTIVEGYYAAKMSLNLVGSGIPATSMDVAQLMSPYRFDSPLYPFALIGTPIRYSLVVWKADGSSVVIRQFTGRVADYSISAIDRTVALSCLDGVEDCRDPITLPFASIEFWSSVAGVKPIHWRQNTQWPVDFALRKSGYYQSPPAPSTAIWSSTCHGSVAPEVGYAFTWLGQYGSVGEGEWYVPGLYGLAVNGTTKALSIWRGQAASTFSPSTGDTNEYSIQFLAYFGPDYPRHVEAQGNIVILMSGGYFIGTSIGVRILTTGQVVLPIYSGFTELGYINGPTFATTGWHNVAVKVQFNNMTNARIQWRGSAAFTQDLSGVGGSPTVDTTGATVQLAFSVPVQCIQVTKNPGTDTTVWYDTDTFVPTAVLEPGLNSFISLPEVREVPAWDVIKEAVGAEYGVVGFDEAGVAFFKNRDNLRRASLTIERDVTSTHNLVDLDLAVKLESVRNIIVSSVQPRWEYPIEVVWDIASLEEEWFLTSGFHQFELILDEPAWVPTASLAQYTTTQWNDANTPIFSGFVAINPYTDTEVTAYAAVFPTPNVTYGITIQVTNPNSDPIVFRTTDDNPALTVGGLPIQARTTTTNTYRRESSINAWGGRSFTLPANPYAQDVYQMQQVAQSLLKDLKSPVPVLERFPIVGDPRLQLTDTLEISDLSGLGGPFLAVVAGISREFADGKLTDFITPRPLGTPGSWILGHATRSTLGQTTKLG